MVISISERDFFRDALSDFTFEAASGGAIRHLADLGYTVKQICEKLTYPTPYEKVRIAVWKHLIDTQVILTREPGSGREGRKTDYVVEHDQYGRASFRLISAVECDTAPVRWKERCYREERDGSLAAYLDTKCSVYGGKNAYVSCEFGRYARTQPERFAMLMEALNERQREYITGLPWEAGTCYHRLDGRMREIVIRLYAAEYYSGHCYFMESEEKVKIS